MLGHADRPADLSDRAALARLSAALPAGAPVASSDLVRATATADAVAGDRPRLPPDPALREIDFGAWEGLTADEVEDRARLMAFWDEPGAVSAPDGESWDMLVARVDGAVERLLAPGRPDVIVVAHMGVILTQVQRALRVNAYEAFGHRIEPLSLTRIATGPVWRAEVVGALP
jgi:broad specificity phosphatase PhoE